MQLHTPLIEQSKIQRYKKETKVFNCVFIQIKVIVDLDNTT